MCDICREHDRENRKNKKLRDLGQLPPVRFHSYIGTLKKGGKLKNTPSKEVIGGPAQSTLPEDSAAASSSTVTSSSNDADEVFADLLYPDGVTFNVSPYKPMIHSVLINILLLDAFIRDEHGRKQLPTK
jgi:hypothetical protein